MNFYSTLKMVFYNGHNLVDVEYTTRKRKNNLNPREKDNSSKLSTKKHHSHQNIRTNKITFNRFFIKQISSCTNKIHIFEML